MIWDGASAMVLGDTGTDSKCIEAISYWYVPLAHSLNSRPKDIAIAAHDLRLFSLSAR